MSDEDADESEGGWDSEKNEVEDEPMPDADDEDDGVSEADIESEDEDEEPQSLILKLKVPGKALLNITNGIASPVSTSSVSNTEDATNAGALKEPTSEQTAVKSETTKSTTEIQQQPTSSPLGPSAYPTPTSSSFLAPEQKSTMVPLSSLLNGPVNGPVSQPASHQFMNGDVGHTTAKPESARKEVNLPIMAPQFVPRVDVSEHTNAA